MVNKNQILLSKISVICYLLFLREIEGTICPFDVKIEQRLLNEGFHRNLSIYIDFTSHYGDDFLYEDCMVGIEQTLPRGVYSSPEDINDNRCKSLIHPIFKTAVNIELPAKKAEPIIIHLLSKVKDARTHIYIPVHARYHHAVSGGGIVRNEIPAPMLYLMCPEKRLDRCENLYDEISEENNFCVRDLRRELCPWKEIPAKIVTAPLSWEVPVGNTDHYPLVACGTVVVVVAGSLYLLNTLHKHHARLRTKNKSALSQYLCVSLISNLALAACY